MKAILIIVIFYESTFFRVGHSTTTATEFSSISNCEKARAALIEEISNSKIKRDYTSAYCVKGVEVNETNK